MINAHVPRPLPEPEQEMPQCFEEKTIPCESKEQREQRRRIEVLKNWEIRIQPLDRGCVVHVGCKSIAFVSIEAAHKEIGRYIENPQLVATQHGFGDHF
jgi:hypothetical protein